MTAATALDRLETARYLSVEVELEPVGSPTIQPTSFANTGTSFYEDAEGKLTAVVDSVASLANQLELTIWDETRNAPVPPVESLPWVKVIDSDGDFYTSSRTAAHRLNASSVLTGVDEDGEAFGDRLLRLLEGAKPPLAARLAALAWEHDPLSLVHGCWFPGLWEGRARLTRALSARIDAREVQTQSAQTGGQKTRDTIDEPGAIEDTGFKTVRGEAPYYTSEISAARILAPIVLDLALLRSYGLGPQSERALAAVALLEIGELVASWPRRRSRCMLTAKDVRVREPSGWELPSVEDLRGECATRCEAAMGTKRATPLVVSWKPKAKRKAKP